MSDLNIYEHLSLLQKTVKAPKSEANPFQKWNYRTVDGILEAVKALKPEGSYILMSDEPILVGEFHYVKATITFGYKDQQIVVHSISREPLEERNKNGVLSKLPQQVTASSSTFARKMALCGMFAIDNSDVADVDTQDQEDIYDYKKQQSSTKKSSETISNTAAIEISGLIAKTKSDVKVILAHYKVGSLNDLNWDQYHEACSRLEAKFKQGDYLKV